MSYGVADLPGDTVLARATAAAERAIRLASDVADTWMAVGFRQWMRTRIGQGDFLDEAVAALARATQLDSSSAEAHHQYGQGLIVAGRDSAALAEYRRALALEPGRAVTLQEIGFVFLLEGRNADAAAWCDSALTADPRMFRGYAVRARVLLASGDVAGAGRDAATALLLAPNDQTARDAHAMVLAATGDTAAAVREVGRDIRTQIGAEPLLFVGQVDGRWRRSRRCPRRPCAATCFVSRRRSACAGSPATTGLWPAAPRARWCGEGRGSRAVQQLAPKDSNLHYRIQSPESCHWTRGHRAAAA